VKIDGRFRDGMAFRAGRLYLASSECMVGPAGQKEHDPELDKSDSNWPITERLTVRRTRPKQNLINMPLRIFHIPEEVEVVSGYQFAMCERSVMPHGVSPVQVLYNTRLWRAEHGPGLKP